MSDFVCVRISAVHSHNFPRTERDTQAFWVGTGGAASCIEQQTLSPPGEGGEHVAGRSGTKNTPPSSIRLLYSVARAGACKFFTTTESLITCTVLTVILLPTDWLLRRLDALDSQSVSSERSTEASSTPLLYQLLDSTASPIGACLREYVNAGTFALPDILSLWWHRAGCPPSWWHKWGLRVLSTLLHQSANILQRLGLNGTHLAHVAGVGRSGSLGMLGQATWCHIRAVDRRSLLEGMPAIQSIFEHVCLSHPDERHGE